LNNVNYFVAVRLPMEKLNTVNDLMDLSVSQPFVLPTSATATASTLAVVPNAPVSRLSDVATVRPG